MSEQPTRQQAQDAAKLGKCYRGRTYTRRPLPERLMAKVEKGTADECWEWTGYRMPSRGYGQILEGAGSERLILVHRASYLVHVGPIPDGLLVLHACDNPPCCNPAHLFLGTYADNVADMDQKGRRRPRSLRGDDHWTRKRPDLIPRGVASRRAKLTQAQVNEIRRRYAAGGISQERLGEQFDVKQTTISKLVRGISYATP